MQVGTSVPKRRYGRGSGVGPEKHGRNGDTRPPKTRGEFEEEWIEVTLAKARKRKGGPRKRSRDAVKHNVFTFGGSGKVGGSEQKTGAETIAAVGKTSSKELHVKLVALTEKDDVEVYLVTFERINMQAYKVDKAYWIYLNCPVEHLLP